MRKDESSGSFNPENVLRVVAGVFNQNPRPKMDRANTHMETMRREAIYTEAI